MYFHAFFCNLSILWTEFSALSWIRLAWMDENLSMNYNCEAELFVSYCDHFECGSQCFESFSVFFSVWRRLTECTWNTVIQIYSVYIEKKNDYTSCTSVFTMMAKCPLQLVTNNYSFKLSSNLYVILLCWPLCIS